MFTERLYLYVGQLYEDKDYYNNLVCPLFSKVFNLKILAHEKKSNSVYGFYICNKEVVKLFIKFGFTNKKTSSVRIPQEIMKSKDKKIWVAFIRGFADCDGCFSLMKRKGKYKLFKLKFNTYPRISIKIISKGMIEDIHLLLAKLNLKHTFGIERKDKANEADAHWIMIRGEKNIEDWMKVIGFNNPSKKIKYEVWKKFGFCPSNSGINERKLFLKGVLKPEDFYEN
jgi:hypothetical protein